MELLFFESSVLVRSLAIQLEKAERWKIFAGMKRKEKSETETERDKERENVSG